MTEKKPIDWELIEKHYRAGLLSLREICKEVGDTVTEGAVRKRAKKDGWTRDLSAKIAQRADDLVRREEVRKEAVRKGSTQLSPADEKAVVEVNAQRVADVDLKTRVDINDAFGVQKGLLEELAALSNPEFFESLEKLGELLDESGPNASGTFVRDKANEVYRYIISLEGRVKMAKDIAGAYGVYAPMLRKMYGLEGEKDRATNVDDLIKKIHSERIAA